MKRYACLICSICCIGLWAQAADSRTLPRNNGPRVTVSAVVAPRPAPRPEVRIVVRPDMPPTPRPVVRPVPPVPPPPPVPAVVPAPRPHVTAVPLATPTQVDAMIRILRQERSELLRLERAQRYVRLYGVRTTDLVRLAAELAFDSDRLELLKYAYTYCPDRQHYPRLRVAFTFQTGYDRLMDWVVRR
ncbi:MAG: DUF4476 domain-containing protein [Bacteroidales bacterium]|nr:DUF4476 domain-containing protein [Bacteroidales bacterium]